MYRLIVYEYIFYFCNVKLIENSIHCVYRNITKIGLTRLPRIDNFGIKSARNVQENNVLLNLARTRGL